MFLHQNHSSLRRRSHCARPQLLQHHFRLRPRLAGCFQCSAERMNWSSLFPCIGIIGDATLVQLGLLQFQSYPNIFGSPLWMIALWACFGTMLRPLFSWFLDHCWRSILGFSIGGVVAYWSGQKLGVLEFSNSWVSALGIAGEWAIAGTVLRFLHLKFPEPYKE